MAAAACLAEGRLFSKRSGAFDKADRQRPFLLTGVWLQPAASHPHPIVTGERPITRNPSRANSRRRRGCLLDYWRNRPDRACYPLTGFPHPGVVTPFVISRDPAVTARRRRGRNGFHLYRGLLHHNHAFALGGSLLHYRLLTHHLACNGA